MYSSSLASEYVPTDRWVFTPEYSPPEIHLPEHPSINVKSCGVAEANGQWKYDSQVAGRPKYVKGNGQITWIKDRNEWQMRFSGKATVYHSIENSPDVPANGWKHLKGPMPPKISVLAPTGSVAYCARMACEEPDED